MHTKLETYRTPGSSARSKGVNVFTTEQKAWQLHENGVTYGELYMVVQQRGWDFDNPNGVVGFSMNDAIETLWKERLGSR